MMKRLLHGCLWTAVFVALILGLDQFLRRFPWQAPAAVSLAASYTELRASLLGLGIQRPAPTVEAAIEAAALRPRPPAAVPGPHYLYLDAQGQLQFADTLDEIPSSLRASAQNLSR